MSDALTLGPRPSAVPLGDGSHDVETQPGAGNAGGNGSGDTMEAFENFLELDLGDAVTLIADTYGRVFLIDNSGLHGDSHIGARILHGVVDQVGNGSPNFVEIGLHHDGFAGAVN